MDARIKGVFVAASQFSARAIESNDDALVNELVDGLAKIPYILRASFVDHSGQVIISRGLDIVQSESSLLKVSAPILFLETLFIAPNFRLLSLLLGAYLLLCCF